MKRLALLALLLATASPLVAQDGDPLVAGWENPPPDARPLAYWQWINGNVSEPGIRADLAWMHRVGMGGVFLFDVGFNTPPVPQIVEQRIGFGTPEWRSAVHLAAAEADRLNLSFGAQSGGGWSVSGDPGVTPEQAMKKLVWSETIVTPGAGPVRLAPLPIASGPFQDYPIADRFRDPQLGGEIAVVAYRINPSAAETAVTITGVADAHRLSDDRYDTPVALVPDAQGTATLSFAFDQPVSPGALTLSVDGPFPGGEVRDGAGAVRVTLPGPAQLAAPARTYALAGGASQNWSISFHGLTAPLRVREARFVPEARIHRFEDKAGYGTQLDHGAIRSPAAVGTPSAETLDLTERLAPDGTLDWHPREGRWTVLRFGWSLTGRRNTPAAVESTGLEIDKLDAAIVRAYADRFYGRLADAVGSGRMDVALTDSWEAGTQNWSPGLLREFRQRRGYDPTPWLPALAGRIMDDTEESERFLADWRRTIADLIAENHYGIFAQTLKARGLTYFAAAPGTDIPTVADSIQAKSQVAVPMGEYWYWTAGGAPKPDHVADIREAASAAHLTGRTQVAAEALTTMGDEPWATGPREWRRSVDRFFSEGVNRVVMHTSAHQPFVDGRRPGITLRQYGQHYTRNESWADLADGWTGYLSRSSFLLQQGRSMADVAVFYGEEAPVGAPPGYVRPPGYDYDFVDGGGIRAMSVQDGRFVSAGGARYAVLTFAPQVRRLSLETLASLASLVEAGGTLVAARPTGPTGRLPAGNSAYAQLVERIWGPEGAAGPNRLGKGLVHTAGAVEPVLAGHGLVPDVANDGVPLDWAHRQVDGDGLYFLSNPQAAPFAGRVYLRAGSGSARAEIWDAETGERRSIASALANGIRTVALELPAGASRFLVLRPGPEVASIASAALTTTPITGNWSVEFLDGMGAPQRASFDHLRSFTESQDPAIRFYSGRARYTIDFDLPQGALLDGALLNLGQVGDMARINLNGQDLGVLWSETPEIQTGGHLREGTNRLQITVASYWQNRLIGDRQPGATPQTFAIISPYTAATPLRPAGLMGPVTLKLRQGD